MRSEMDCKLGYDIIKKGVKIHDLIVLQEFFLYGDIDRDTGVETRFIIWYSKNDLLKLGNYLKQGHKLIGYNSLEVNSQLLEYILQNYERWISISAQEVTNEIYFFLQKVIAFGKERKYVIPSWKLSNEHLDLFRMWNLDNPKHYTRLEDIQFCLNWPRISMMPFDAQTKIESWDQIEALIDFNSNKISSIYEFYRRSFKQILLRRKLSTAFGLNLLNSSNSKMGLEIFLKLYSRHTGIALTDLRKLSTPRDSIKLSDIVLNYVDFQDQHLKDILSSILKVTIHSTEAELNYEVLMDGIKYRIGLGGIHGCTVPGRYESKQGYVIRNIDATSFYSWLAITNNFYPRHLGNSFPVLVKHLFDQRCKTPIGHVENFAYKLILNGGVYGESNVRDSPLYDPQYAIQITMNGQLLILMLIEQLVNGACKVLQANTDGLTIIYKESEQALVSKICADWEQLAGVALKHSYYRELIIRDVNCYMGIFTTSDIAPVCKDKFEIIDSGDPEFTEWHRDPSFLIVSKAVYEYFVNKIPVENTIYNCFDIYWFCGRVRFNNGAYGITRELRGGRMRTTGIYQHNTIRYYVSGVGESLFRIHSDKREEAIRRGYVVRIFNDFVPLKFRDYNLNFGFYINEAKKRIRDVELDCRKQQLALF